MKAPVGLLSGGQRQALTLLMATLVTPKLLLLDEHTAALDPATAEKWSCGGRYPLTGPGTAARSSGPACAPAGR